MIYRVQEMVQLRRHRSHVGYVAAEDDVSAWLAAEDLALSKYPYFGPVTDISISSLSDADIIRCLNDQFSAQCGR